MALGPSQDRSNIPRVTTLPAPNTAPGALPCPASTCTQEQVNVNHLPLLTILRLCSSWKAAFPLCALGVGGKTIPGKGFETRRAEFGKQQAFRSRATSSPYRCFAQIRRCLFLQADITYAQVRVDGQSEGWVSAPIYCFIQVLLCSGQLRQLYLAALLSGLLLAPIATTPSWLLGAQSTNSTPLRCPFTLGRPGCLSPLPCLMSVAHVLSGA